MLTRPTTCDHICAAAAPSDRQIARVLDAVEVLVAYWRALPGGPKATERFSPHVKALIAAYDQLDKPQAGVPA